MSQLNSNEQCLFHLWNSIVLAGVRVSHSGMDYRVIEL